MIEVIGWWFSILSAFLMLAILTFLVALANVRASKYFLEMLGGWQSFNRYRKWYHKQKKVTGKE